MKRLILIVVLAVAVTAMVPAQTIDFAQFQADFQTFADAVAGALPTTATEAGLNWAPAYIGQFPHFGIGVSAGAGLIPAAAVTPIFDTVGVQLPTELASYTQYGIPLPGAAIDARLGGFILPFDLGVKVGYLPPEAKNLLGSIQLDYLLVGGDVRVAILKDEGLVPALSVGAGYTYTKGGITMPGVVPASTIDISPIMDYYYSNLNTYTLSIGAGDFGFNWESQVIEGKVQLSKKLLFLVPTIGFSAAYNITSTGGGLATGSLTTSGNTNLADVGAAFEAQGYPAPTAAGITVNAANEGWSFRAFGGLGLSLLFLDIDLSASYDVLTKALGGGANVRIQF
jgi:hypothetical protein